MNLHLDYPAHRPQKERMNQSSHKDFDLRDIFDIPFLILLWNLLSCNLRHGNKALFGGLNRDSW